MADTTEKQSAACEDVPQPITTVIETSAQPEPHVETRSEIRAGGMAQLKKVNRELASIGVTKEGANAQLLGPNHTMSLKGAKNAA